MVHGFESHRFLQFPREVKGPLLGSPQLARVRCAPDEVQQVETYPTGTLGFTARLAEWSGGGLQNRIKPVRFRHRAPIL